MLKSASYKAPGYITQKLFQLVDILKSERDKYAETASKITDRQLRDNINVLAQENNQYASELFSQLQMMGSSNEEQENSGVMIYASITQDKEPDAGEYKSAGSILQLCKDSEKKMIKLYREILNEPYLMEDMRRLMRCQLNGIMYAFLRLKLFSSTL